jgi:nicotinamidase-related amidase
MTEPALDPQRTALLVMDYQAGILAALPDGEALVARCADALEVVRGCGGTVGYVRVAFTDDDVAAMPATNKMAARVGGGRMHADSPATAVHEGVAPRDGDIVVRKTRVGAFSTTDLDDQLRGHGIDTLLLAGVSTSGVVLSTIRDAADKDYRLIVLADLCADPVAEVHTMLVEKVFPRQAEVLSSTDLAALLGAAQRGAVSRSSPRTPSGPCPPV